MHGVNLDLLRSLSTHRPDGRPKDPHAHHRAEHLARQHGLRRALWRARLAWVARLFRPIVALLPGLDAGLRREDDPA